jgi:hypothetical protein
MVTPAARREAAPNLGQIYEVSQRRACQLIGADRSSIRYCLRPARRWLSGAPLRHSAGNGCAVRRKEVEAKMENFNGVRISDTALLLGLRSRVLHAGKYSLVELKRMLPRRNRVAVLIEKEEDITARQVLRRAAEHFSGVSDVTFKIRSCQATMLNVGMIYLQFDGVLVSGSYRGMAGVFARLLPTYDVDPRREPNAMWNWHYMISALSPTTPQRIEEARMRFANALSQLSAFGLKRCYIFGTGPSLAKAKMLDFNDGYKIVCNTVCRDREFFAKVKPDIFVAGDALYHFSDTAHAQTFLRDVERRMEESEFVFCYPAIFDPFLKRRLRKFEDKLIPIPVGETFDLTADMSTTFRLPATGNVLGLLLLPIACQLSRDVRLLGFDGRRPEDENFWANSSEHSYPELIKEMVLEYPAFYEHYVPKTNPSHYVNSVHGDDLDQAMSKAENQGWQFTLLSPSTSPALAKRPVL